MSTTSQAPGLLIAQVAQHTGLTPDTLRWHEKQGLLPRVPRGSDGRRRYDPASVRFIELVVRLRRTGMPVEQVHQFVDLLALGAISHGRRRALLAEHRQRVLDQIAQLHTDLQAVEHKIAHYDTLIDRGLDCHEQPITDPQVLRGQRSPR